MNNLQKAQLLLVFAIFTSSLLNGQSIMQFNENHYGNNQIDSAQIEVAKSHFRTHESHEILKYPVLSIPLNIGAGDQYYPVIGNNEVFWLSKTSDECAIYSMKLFDFFDIEKIVDIPLGPHPFGEHGHTNEYFQFNYFDGHLLFEDYRNGNWDVFIVDVETKEIFQVTSNNVDQYQANYSNGGIYWLDASLRLFYYDIKIY